MDKAKARIGDRIHYEIRVVADPSLKVHMPPFAENLAGFSVKDFRTPPPKTNEDGRVVYRQWYELDTFVTGAYIIPPATITYTTPNGKQHKIKTTEVFVEVVSSLDKKKEKAADIREIRDPLMVPRPGLSLAAKAGIAVAALIIALAGAFFLLRTIKKRKPAEPPTPPHIVAQEALQELLQKSLIERGQIREFYYELSAIVRCYIEDRFGLHAPEQTTEEFLYSLRETDELSSAHKALLEDFLAACDVVKYARHIPTRTEVQDCFDKAHRFVIETAEQAESEEQKVAKTAEEMATT